MNCELQLVAAHAPQRSACAWFIPGPSAARWLAALAELPLDAAQARLFIVPCSASDRTPFGALLVDVNAAAAAARANASPPETTLTYPPYAQPYGCVAGRVFVPIDAAFRPPAAPAELQELVLGDTYYVWHPAVGLTPFAPNESVAPASLLCPPPETLVDWTRALPGVALNERLHSLTATFTRTLTEVMEEAREEIATEAKQLAALPPSPREAPAGLAAQVQRGASTLVANTVLAITERGSGLGRHARRLMRLVLLLAGVVLVCAVLFAVGRAVLSLINWFASQSPVALGGSALPALLALAAVVGGIWLLQRLTTRLPGPLFPMEVPVPSPQVGRALRWLARAAFAVLLFALLLPLFTQPGTSIVPWLVAAGVLAFVFLVLPMLVRWFPSAPAPEQGRANATRTAQPRPSPAPPKPGLVARLRAWATQRLEVTRQAVDAARHREIERLLHALDTDPDAGLRFALPLAGAGTSSPAPPGTHLGTRSTDFRLGAGSGRGPADVWTLRDDYIRKLTLRYRELANREISLGRHRRAAYIFAQLLGDWPAAAKTLADGRHYREAATVYEERLGDRLQAARCLEGGGLLAEAIVVYDRLGLHETVGDLYTKLEQRDDAEGAYRRAVAARRQSGDPLGAAQLLEEKVLAPEEAWLELAAAWPGSPQAERCLRAAFAWTVRHNESERARRYLGEVTALAQTTPLKVRVAQFAAEVATTYPEPGVCAAAAETTLQLASPLLPQAANAAELATLTAAVERLAASDRLLARDAERYRRGRKSGAPAQAPAPRPRRQALHCRHECKLPLDHVAAAASAGRSLFLAGRFQGQLKIARGNWAGQFHFAGGPLWAFPPESVEPPVLLAVDAADESTLCVHVVGRPPLETEREFPRTDLFPHAVKAGNFASCTPHTVALIDAGASQHRVDLVRDQFVFYTLRGRFTLVHSETCPLGDGLPGQLHLPLPYQSYKGVSLFAVGNVLYVVDRGQMIELTTFPDDVRQLEIAPRYSPHENLAAVAFTQGAAVVWNVVSPDLVTRFADYLVDPRLLLHRDGWIIAASRTRGEVYVVQQGQLFLHAAAEWSDVGEIVAVLPGPVAHEFATVTAQGHLRRFEFPAAVSAASA